jgi:hypothetical protein
MSAEAGTGRAVVCPRPGCRVPVRLAPDLFLTNSITLFHNHRTSLDSL